eukprot:s2928_g6.t1
MSWVVAIPTYDRVDSLRKKTLQLLLSAGISATRIFVFADPGQFPTYQEALEPLGLKVVKGRKGICNQRNAIMEHFKPGDRIVEMDDDISCLLTTTGALRSDRSARTVPVPEENLEFVIDHIWEIADRERCKLWGIYPTPNTYMLSRTYTLGLAKSTGQMQGYYNPGDVQLTVAVMEDYERVLHFYSRGISCMRCDFLSVKSDNKGRGGCASAFVDYSVEAKEKDEKVLRHPREVAEANAIKQLSARYPSLIKYSRPPKAVQKIVPVHGKVKYHPPGWRLMFKSQNTMRYISATDVSGTFALKLGLGKDVKPIETVGENGSVLDKNREGKQGPDDTVEPLEPEDEDEEDEDRDELELDLLILRSLKMSELRELCQTAGLPDSGSRVQLIYRLINPENVDDDPEPGPKKRKKEEKEKTEKTEKIAKRRESKDEVKERKEPKDRREPKPKELQDVNFQPKGVSKQDSEEEDELSRLEAIFAEHEAQEQESNAERPGASKDEETEEARKTREMKEATEAIEAKRKEDEALQVNRAMQALMQAEAARETQQRLLGQQAEQILEACGRVPPEAPSATGQLQPAPLMPLSTPSMQVWQPASAMRQLRQLVPRYRSPTEYPQRRLDDCVCILGASPAHNSESEAKTLHCAGESLKAAATCFFDANELGDSLNKAKALRDGGRCSLASGKVTAGEQAVQAAIEIFREQDAKRLEADEFIALSELLLNVGKAKAALCAAEQGMVLLKVLGASKVEEVAALIKVSDCMLALNKGRAALMRGQEAAKRCKGERAEALALQDKPRCAPQLLHKAEAWCAERVPIQAALFDLFAWFIQIAGGCAMLSLSVVSLVKHQLAAGNVKAGVDASSEVPSCGFCHSGEGQQSDNGKTLDVLQVLTENTEISAKQQTPEFEEVIHRHRSKQEVAQPVSEVPGDTEEGEGSTGVRRFAAYWKDEAEEAFHQEWNIKAAMGCSARTGKTMQDI